MFRNLSNFASRIASNLATNIATNVQNTNNNTINTNNKAPPASQKVLSTLPMVKVTADDILEATNKECLICLDEQKVGSWSCKLQCGHLFHKQCVIEWLEKHCTCPVCRFELETDDINYETDRKKRMKKRKLRLRIDEIKNKSISQLRDLCNNLNLNINDCLDKSEIVDRLVQSGLIDITEGLPPIELNEEDFNRKTVSELRYLLLSFGLSDKDALEKSDLRLRLLESGRVILIKPTIISSSSGLTSDNDKDTSETFLNNNSNKDYSIHNHNMILKNKLKDMKLSQLRKLCQKYHINISNVVDKNEIIEYLLASEHIHNIDMFNNNEDEDTIISNIDHNDYIFIDKKYTEYDDSSNINKEKNHSSYYNSNNNTNTNNAGIFETDPIIDNLDTTIENNESKFPTMSNNNSYIFGSSIEDTNYTDHLPCSNKKYKYQDEDDDIDIHMNEDDRPVINHNNYESSTSNHRTINTYNNTDNLYRNVYDSINNTSSSSIPNSMETDLNDSNMEELNDEKLSLSTELLQEMSIKEIKNIMQAYHIETNGCLEKSDMIHRMKSSNLINIIA